jgi:hypothetical protein
MTGMCHKFLTTSGQKNVFSLLLQFLIGNEIWPTPTKKNLTFVSNPISAGAIDNQIDLPHNLKP